MVLCVGLCQQKKFKCNSSNQRNSCWIQQQDLKGAVQEDEWAGMGCRWHQKGIFVSITARPLVSFTPSQRSSVLPRASVYLSVIPGGSRGCAGGWQGGFAGLLMQHGPSCLGQDSGAREDRANHRLERREGEKIASAKRQVSFRGRQQLKDQNYQPKPQDHIRCQAGHILFLPPERAYQHNQSL